MDDLQKKLLLSHVQRALEDRHIGIVSEKTGINRRTIAKARNGATNLNAGSVTVLCNYLGIDTPKDETN